MLFRQSSLSLHVKHEITPANKFDDEKESRGCLKAGVEANQERMIGGCLEHMLLCLHPVDILAIGLDIDAAEETYYTYLIIGDQFLFDHLHGVDAFGFLQLHHQHFGVAAAANDANEVKVSQRNGFASIVSLS